MTFDTVPEFVKLYRTGVLERRTRSTKEQWWLDLLLIAHI